MFDIEIVDVTFVKYKKEIEHLKNQNDLIEIRFQNEIVKPFLSILFPDFDVVDTSTKLPESDKHDYLQYCGTYINKAGKKQAWTPDLVIAKNWNRFNKENDVDYRAVIEVKSPYLQERIYNKEYKKYGSKLITELKSHLSAKKNDKVILTDTLKWEFYKKNEEGNELVPIRTFKLYDLCGKRGKWEWKKEETKIVEDDFINENYISPLDNQEPLKEFEALKEFLKEFLSSNLFG